MAAAPKRSRNERAGVAAVEALDRTQVVVIGGGINGIATFRDLALQGVDVVLVERADYVSGASAASSHMIHGGIRYLEYGEFRLVQESVRERNDLLRTAPHFVRPLETTIPIYSLFSGLLSAPLRFLFHRSGKPSERGALLIKVGLVFYDLFSRGGRQVPRHRFAGRRRTLAQLPDLDPSVRFSATYFDAGVADPERLAIDVLLDGVGAHAGAHALNYVEAVGRTSTGVTLRDVETGREFALDADVIVNATGPWADETGRVLGEAVSRLGGTKGSHIVLDHPALLRATRGREIFFEYDDGRIVLVYPIGDRVLVGTTDIEADVDEAVECTEDEVDYFLGLIASVFPAIPVDRTQIVYRFSGIRPLPRHEGQAAGAVSRDYRIEDGGETSGPRLLTLVGGKWTTFRALGETLSTRILAVLGATRTVDTLGRPIGGGRDFPADPAAREAWLEDNLRSLQPSRRSVLLRRYGTRALDVARAEGTSSGSVLSHASLSPGELTYLVVNEHAVHLADVVFRRTDLAFTGRADMRAIEEIGAAMGTVVGWDDIRLDREIEDCLAQLRRHGVIREEAPLT